MSGKLYIIFPDNISDFMPVNDMLLPAKFFSSYGAVVVTQTEFFNNTIKDITQQDKVMVYITVKQQWRETFKNLKCYKILRNIDSAKCDGVLFRTDIELHEEVGGFDKWFICYATDKHMQHLKSKNVNAEAFPHCLDFSNMLNPDDARKLKQADVIISGQQHETLYPDRWKLLKFFESNKNYKSAFLPHPGFEISGRRHDMIGENYVQFLQNFWVGPIGAAGDRLYMKFLEFAKAYVLPLGTIPSNVDENTAKLMCDVGGSLDTQLDIENKISSLFENKDLLWERIVEYSQKMKNAYDVKLVTKKVYDSIMLEHDTSFIV